MMECCKEGYACLRRRWNTGSNFRSPRQARLVVAFSKKIGEGSVRKISVSRNPESAPSPSILPRSRWILETCKFWEEAFRPPKNVWGGLSVVQIWIPQKFRTPQIFGMCSVNYFQRKSGNRSFQKLSYSTLKKMKAFPRNLPNAPSIWCTLRKNSSSLALLEPGRIFYTSSVLHVLSHCLEQKDPFGHNIIKLVEEQ